MMRVHVLHRWWEAGCQHVRWAWETLPFWAVARLPHIATAVLITACVVGMPYLTPSFDPGAVLAGQFPPDVFIGGGEVKPATAIPEPGTIVIFGLAVLIVVLLRLSRDNRH